jgi:hypothetical protein
MTKGVVTGKRGVERLPDFHGNRSPLSRISTNHDHAVRAILDSPVRMTEIRTIYAQETAISGEVPRLAPSSRDDCPRCRDSGFQWNTPIN